jgi:hypothetical protein
VNVLAGAFNANFRVLSVHFCSETVATQREDYSTPQSSPKHTKALNIYLFAFFTNNYQRFEVGSVLTWVVSSFLIFQQEEKIVVKYAKLWHQH